MKEKLHAIIKPDYCNTCIHNAVCNYKQDYQDICSALARCEVVKQLGSQGMSSKKVTFYDILGEVIIKCKHYYNGEKIRQDSGGITFQSYPKGYFTGDPIDTNQTTPTITNPCDISTSTSSISRSNLTTTTDYIFG